MTAATAAATGEGAAGDGAPPVRSVTAVVGLLVLFELVSGFLQAGIAPNLPSIGDTFGVSDSAVALVVSVQLLSAAVCAPAMGRLGDLYGHRRMLRIAPACVAVSMVAIPESVRRAAGRVDRPGVVLLGLAVLGLLAGVSSAGDHGWLSGRVLAPALAGLALLAVRAFVELRTAEPLVDLRAMADRHVAPFYFASFAFGVVYFGGQSPNSTFFATDPDEAGYAFGLSSLSIALTMLPAMIAGVAGSAGTARIAGKIGYRGALIGSFLLVGTGFVAFAAAHGALWQVVTELTLMGLGMGTALGAMPTVIAEASDPSRTGVATAVYNNVKTVGGAVAGGLFGTLLAAPAGRDDPSEGGYVAVWLIGAAFALLAALLAVAARRREA